MLDETHDPSRKSWVESANRAGCDFPIQNLPLGAFRSRDKEKGRLGVAIGDAILDIGGWLPGETLNVYLALPTAQRSELRRVLSDALTTGSPRRELVLQSECEMLVPAQIGDYTDFYASVDHAMNVGRLFRPDNPLLPNYRHVPIAYHGRASSIVVSGTPVRRPLGQLGEGCFGPSAAVDYEIEIGALLGPGNRMGEPLSIAEAGEHVAGICLVNDWSARDIQRWEYQPLGPFLSKSFATSISPWVITAEALEPFRIASPEHETAALPYLKSPREAAFDITVEVYLETRKMAESVMISRGSFASLYWTLDQMLAHQTSNGCPVRPGDLIASGTISGPSKANRGCLLELTSGGSDPLILPSGEQRCFLQDGDKVTMAGFCERPGYVRLSLGKCVGIVLPARQLND